MAIKHKIVINVSDPNGRKANVLRGADVKLPAGYFGSCSEISHRCISYRRGKRWNR